MSVIQSLSDEQFQKQLAFGQAAETAIAKWLMSRGGLILPIYDIEYPQEEKKGPRAFSSLRSYVAPDLLLFRHSGAIWCEAKRKTHFTWYRKLQRWETGIDLRVWNDYRELRRRSKLPLMLLFLHCSDTPHTRDIGFGCPVKCPVGLFGKDSGELERCGRTDARWGKSGMIYWGQVDLEQMASIDEMLPFMS
jgi:hypothetical protein